MAGSTSGIAASIAVLLLMTACGAPQTGGTANPQLAFTIELLDGSTFDLLTHQTDTGRPVVINLWASWCVPCRKEMPAIDRVAQSRSDITIIGIAVQDRAEPALAFATEVGVGYPLAIDRDQQVENLFRIPGLPMTVFVAPTGEVVGTAYGELSEADLEGHLARLFGP